MNAEDFYEQFKETLRYLGPGWAGKEQIEVRVSNGKFIMIYGDRRVSFKMTEDPAAVPTRPQSRSLKNPEQSFLSKLFSVFNVP